MADSPMDDMNISPQGKESFRTIDISFRGICLTLSGRQILRDVYGEVNSGEILFVMGPTGAGKTSLMNVLSGRRPTDEGEILANGKQMTRHQRRMVGYVEQNDSFIATLTLQETLKFKALLSLPSTMSYKSKMERVQQVIDILELRKCQHTMIGNATIRGLSGGEKKRTSIACELLTNPALLTMDEPTTGLDSNTAYNLIYSVKQFCVKYHKSVIINIHQPSSQLFYLSDKLLLLINGQVGYYGRSMRLLPHFSGLGLECPPHYNPADFVMDCARGDESTVAKLVDSARGTKDHYDNDGERANTGSGESQGFHNSAFISDDLVKIPTKKRFDMTDEFLLGDVDVFYDPKLKYQSSYKMQLLVLTLRGMKMHWRAITRPLNLAAMSILLAILIGLFFDSQATEEYMRNRIGFIYFIHVHQMFRTTLATVVLTIESFPVVFKERLSNSYHLSALCVAVYISDLLCSGLVQLLIAAVGYWTTGFRSISTFFFLITNLLLMSSAMAGIAAVEFTVLNDIASSYLAVVLSCFSAFLISGYVLNPLPSWVAWARYVVPFGYSFNAVIHQHLGLDFPIPCSNTTSAFTDCNTGMIDEFESSRLLANFPWVFPIWGSVFMLVLASIVLRVVNYALLRFWRTPRKQIKNKSSTCLLKLKWDKVFGRGNQSK